MLPSDVYQVLTQETEARRMTLNRNKIKNLIMSEDRNFRSQAARLFGDIAFVGEKLFFSKPSDALATLQFDRFAQNLCVAPDQRMTPDYLALLSDINKIVTGTQIMVLAYFRLDQAREMKQVEAALPYLRLFLLPVKRSDFVATFRTMRALAVEGFKPPVVQVENGQVKAQSNKIKASPQTVNFVEATQHVRECIEWANQILKDPSDLDALRKIGQRFNGIAGTFVFLNTKPGYRELHQIAVIIDNVSRVYQDAGRASGQAVSRAHSDLLLAAVKCAFMCLKILREGQALSEQQMAEVSTLQRLYGELVDDSKRQEQGQDAVDQLIDRLRAG